MAGDGPFVADPIYRIFCPALNLDPPDTDPSLFPAALAHFSAIPWCAAHLQAPGAVPFLPGCRNPASPLDNQLLGNALRTEATVSHMLSFIAAADAACALDPARPVPAVHTLFACGDGVSGYPGVVQGGMVMALVDDAMGAVLELNMVLGKDGAAFKANAVTARMDVQFLKPVQTNTAAHIVAWIDSTQGRRTKVAAKMVNGDGDVLLKCASTWVTLKPNM
jgi:acyl-coenzyme A thioesterase PaaI-like protein